MTLKCNLCTCARQEVLRWPTLEKYAPILNKGRKDCPHSELALRRGCLRYIVFHNIMIKGTIMFTSCYLVEDHLPRSWYNFLVKGGGRDK